MTSAPVVVGIDVGGPRKGYHAVALRDRQWLDVRSFNKPAELADWCFEQRAEAIAVDAPCAWSQESGSRRAERELAIGGEVIQCFKTPTRERALANGSGFYGWVFNGEDLYRELLRHAALFDGQKRPGRTVLETFPHAIACAIAGKVIAAKPKARTRRQCLQTLGYELGPLRNIDFVDAALCAHAARCFLTDRWQPFGDRDEGFIVLPR